MIEAIKKYFEKCPLFSGGRINVNYLGGNSTYFSIDNVAAEPVIKKYCDGSSLRQFVFVLAVRGVYDENVALNLRNSRFFEDMEDWVLKQNRSGIFPETAEDCKGVCLEVTKSGCLYDSNAQNGRMQTEMRFIYQKN